MILFLDTSESKKLVFALIDPHSRKVLRGIITLKPGQSDKTLYFLDKFLKSDKRFRHGNFGNISKIYVVSGPGSFTGIRTGISISLGISFALGISVYALKKKHVPRNLLEIERSEAKKVKSGFEPEYGSKPKITMGGARLAGKLFRQQ